MTEYIEREKAFDAVFGQFCASSDETEAALNAAIEEIRVIPAADVREVKRGKWALVHYDDGYGGYDLYTHKECGCMQTRPRNFCHNCGAEMEAGDG